VFREIWEGSAVLVPPRVTLVTPEGLFDEHYVDERDVAEALERLYRDAAFRADMTAAARRVAARPDYAWDAVARRWRELFQALLRSTGSTGSPGTRA
jgi:glycosyltransferase involved in cell wall biosynthesis